MKKKIQVSSVELKALSEVIVLNSSFVAKAIRAADAAKKLEEHLNAHCPIITGPVTDPETGIVEEVGIGKDWEEWQCRSYNVEELSRETVVDLFEKLVPFAIELSDALLGDEA